jgi:hypothetical protein
MERTLRKGLEPGIIFFKNKVYAPKFKPVGIPTGFIQKY